MALSKILPASQDQYAGARNLIINGAMQVAQRGTSFTAGGYSLDHWYIAETGTCTVTQDTADVPSNFKYAMKTTTSAASSFIAIYQPFESVDYEAFKNKTVTISFYAKVNSTFSGTMFVDMQNGDTADTLLSGTWAGNDPQYITPTTSWARYSVSIAIGSSNGVRFVISPSASQASGAEYSITGVQLEVGQATPFEHRSYADELARCQRYFFKTYAQGTAIGTATEVNCSFLPMHESNNYARTPLDFPVSMRTTPTFVSYNTNNGTSGQVSGDASNYTAAPSALGSDRVSNGVSGSTLGKSVYLKWHCTADAEL